MIRVWESLHLLLPTQLKKFRIGRQFSRIIGEFAKHAKKNSKEKKIGGNFFSGYRDLKGQTDGWTDIILLCIIDNSYSLSKKLWALLLSWLVYQIKCSNFLPIF